MGYFFFFSSRRRHTRFDCDWSSDVCSSDLTPKSGTSLSRLAAIPTSKSWTAAYCAARCFPKTTSNPRSEEHTSELQSQSNLVCRLLLEKKKKEIDFQAVNYGMGRMPHGLEL